MEKSNSKLSKIFIVVIYIYFLAGAVWHFLPQTKAMVVQLTPYGLAAFSLAIFSFNQEKINQKTIYWITSIFLATIILEIIGVHTSAIFGSYYYSNVMGIKLFGVPVMIGLNWTVVIIGLFALTENAVKTNIYIKSFMIGLLAVLFDFILEPVAVKLNYWQWENDIIPFKNYAAWFLIALIMSFIGFKLKAKFKNIFIIHYIFAQFLFFILLNLLL